MEDRPEPWTKKKNPVAAKRRETRTTARACLGNDIEEEPIPSNLPSGSGTGRRPRKAKPVKTAKGMKKTKSMPAATVDVVLGRAENPIRSVEELSRKTEEDARACGRVTRTVTNPATRKSCPTTIENPPLGEDDDMCQPMPCAAPTSSPITSLGELSGGMTLNPDLSTTAGMLTT